MNCWILLWLYFCFLNKTGFNLRNNRPQWLLRQYFIASVIYYQTIDFWINLVKLRILPFLYAFMFVVIRFWELKRKASWFSTVNGMNLIRDSYADTPLILVTTFEKVFSFQFWSCAFLLFFLLFNIFLALFVYLFSKDKPVNNQKLLITHTAKVPFRLIASGMTWRILDSWRLLYQIYFFLLISFQIELQINRTTNLTFWQKVNPKHHTPLQVTVGTKKGLFSKKRLRLADLSTGLTIGD